MKTYLIASLTAFFLSAAFTKLLLPVLRKLKAGQNILCYVKEHAKKAGTPTMGGLSFIAAAFVAACLFVGEPDGTFIVTLCLALAYAAVGFLDDSLKIRRKDNLGLKPYQKIIFQGAAAILAGIYCYRSGTVVCRLPFCGKSVNFRGFIVPFAAFVFVALVNAVNLTDGLDALAGGASAAYFFSFGVLIALQNAATGKAGTENSLALICFVALRFSSVQRISRFGIHGRYGLVGSGRVRRLRRGVFGQRFLCARHRNNVCVFGYNRRCAGHIL